VNTSTACTTPQTLSGGRHRTLDGAAPPPLGNNLMDNLMLWRNEMLRPQPQQSPETLAGFELKSAMP